jgi:hypothetical protein
MKGSIRRQVVFVTKLVLEVNRNAACGLGGKRLRCLPLGKALLFYRGGQ